MEVAQWNGDMPRMHVTAGVAERANGMPILSAFNQRSQWSAILEMRRRPTDLDTPWGVVREAHLAAANSLYADLLRRRVGIELALARARHLQHVSPAAASLLEFWILAINVKRTSWADLLDEE